MKSRDRWNISWQTLRGPLIFEAIFIGIAIWRFAATGKAFFLFNFGYIGTAIALGAFLNGALPKKHILWGRRIGQILVASYMVGYLGIIARENMQIEGFFIYLLMGVFAGATLHYFIAKVVGPIFLNRGWCGWACWTAMVLDLLPWRRPRAGRIRGMGVIRYVHFALSLVLVLVFWFALGGRETHVHRSPTELYWLAGGNALYYIVGITLAAVLKDNRAFCKYVCPIPTLQKIGARFALWKMAIDPVTCTDCGICERECPMNIKLLVYKNANQRVLSTECILCHTCANVCPQSAVSLTTKFDLARAEHLAYKD